LQQDLNQLFDCRPLRRILISLIIMLSSVYLVLFTIIGIHARNLLTKPASTKYDAALILGNRTYLHGAPNPCLTGRVDKGLMLAEQGIVSTLAMTGGRDSKDFKIEGELMAAYAKSKGYKGPILIESRSRSTKENLEFSAPMLRSANIRSVIIVSEPYHLWRTEKLVNAGHLGQNFKVGYAAASSQCWTSWGMLHKGALREPLAFMHNYAIGYFH
jgi:uncharacterized SAM-binding protein YcdF (DUF218 family)